MTDKHVVRFEPVGIDIEVREDQNVLRAAAEQGIMLMHGCKEGQCSSCKSFVLDGEDYRAGQVLDLRPARLREGRRLHAALSDARLRRRDDRAAQLRRGHDPVRAADPAGGRGGRVHRRRHARHASRRAPARGAHRAQVLPRSVPRHRDPRHRVHALVLDGQHLQPGQRPARVRDQGLSGRAVLAASWTPSWRSATGSTSSVRSVSSPFARVATAT